MGKYQIVKKMKMVCRCADSKVGLYATAVIKNNETGQLHAQIKMKNLSKKAIRTVSVNIQAWDSYHNPLKGVEEYTYPDIMALPGKYFAGQLAVPLISTATHDMIVNLVRVVYADGEIWENHNYVPFHKVKWYKRFLPVGSLALVAAVAVTAGVLATGTGGIAKRSFDDIPFTLLTENASADEVVQKLGENYATMSDGNQYFLNYGTYEIGGRTGNLELFFDQNQQLSQMVWDMGYATDDAFSGDDLAKLADCVKAELGSDYTLDDSDEKNISYTWDVDGISYELKCVKTNRGNGVTLESTSDGYTKL